MWPDHQWTLPHLQLVVFVLRWVLLYLSCVWHPGTQRPGRPATSPSASSWLLLLWCWRWWWCWCWLCYMSQSHCLMFTTGALRLDWVRVRQRVKMAPVPAHQITSCCLLKQKHSNVQISSGKNITKYWREHPGLDGLFLTRQGRNKSSGVQLYSHQLKQTRLGNKVNFYNWKFLLNIANRYHCKLQCHHNQNYTKNEFSTNFWHRHHLGHKSNLWYS